MINKIRDIIEDVTKIPRQKIQEDSSLVDLVAESFVMVELMLAIQEDFSVTLTSNDLDSVKTIKELTTLIQVRVNEESILSAEL